MTQPTPADLRDALLAGLRTPKPLRRHDIGLAYERHQLLAIRFHAAARLNQGGKAKERERWARYFREHFPRGGEHADLLWSQWRKPLLRSEPAGPGVLVTHGRPETHWQQGTHASVGGLVVDLESMWDDFESSVESFVLACAGDGRRARRALRRWSGDGEPVLGATAPGSAPRLSTLHAASTSTSRHHIVYTVSPHLDRIGEV